MVSMGKRPHFATFRMNKKIFYDPPFLRYRAKKMQKTPKSMIFNSRK